jgi:hypothetical protein
MSAYDVNKQVAAHPVAFMEKHESLRWRAILPDTRTVIITKNRYSLRRRRRRYLTPEDQEPISLSFQLRRTARTFSVVGASDPGKYRAVTDDKKTVKGVMYHDGNKNGDKNGDFLRAEIRPLKERRTEERRRSN